MAFESPTPMLFNALKVSPVESHSVISGSLYASNSNFNQKQRLHARFRQHNISGSGIRPSQAIPLPNRHYQYWWIELEQQPAITPLLELAYPIYELIFLGNDNSPFTLAWGNYQSEKKTSNLANLVTGDLNKPENRGTGVSLRAIQVAGGNSRLTPKAEFPWKKWLLWAALAIAALVTGRMAYGLYREMNSPKSVG